MNNCQQFDRLFRLSQDPKRLHVDQLTVKLTYKDGVEKRKTHIGALTLQNDKLFLLPLSLKIVTKVSGKCSMM